MLSQEYAHADKQHFSSLFSSPVCYQRSCLDCRQKIWWTLCLWKGFSSLELKKLSFDSIRKRESLCIFCQKFIRRCIVYLVTEIQKLSGCITQNIARRLNCSHEIIATSETWKYFFSKGKWDREHQRALSNFVIISGCKVMSKQELSVVFILFPFLVSPSFLEWACLLLERNNIKWLFCPAYNSALQ